MLWFRDLGADLLEVQWGRTPSLDFQFSVVLQVFLSFQIFFSRFFGFTLAQLWSWVRPCRDCTKDDGKFKFWGGAIEIGRRKGGIAVFIKSNMSTIMMIELHHLHLKSGNYSSASRRLFQLITSMKISIDSNNNWWSVTGMLWSDTYSAWLATKWWCWLLEFFVECKSRHGIGGVGIWLFDSNILNEAKDLQSCYK